MLATPRSWLAAGGLAVMLLLYGLTPGQRWYVMNVYRDMRDVYDHRDSSLDARGEAVHAHAWRMMMLVREKTPTTARIVLPTGAGHGLLGNRLWCAYYLYPRHLLQEKDVGDDLKARADYILVDKGWGLALSGVPADSIRGDESGLLEVH